MVTTLMGQESPWKKNQTGRITGRVTAASSKEPLGGVNVLLLGTLLGAATDVNGRFVIPYVSPNSYTILVSAIGYKKGEKTIRVMSGQEIHLEFPLQETVLLMDGVVVTASRYRQSIDEIPVSLSLVSAKEISERNITTLDQALRYVPGVNALDGGQISIRGSSGFNWGVGSRVLVLLNGNPFMAGDMKNVNWYALSTSNIEQIEVMKGSGSALYGSSAMGGVINIVTEEPEEGNHFHVRTYTGFYQKPTHPEWRWTDKRQHFEGTAVDISTHFGAVSALISTNYKNTTGYRENDDHSIFNFMTTLGYKFTPTIRFDLTAGYGRNKGGFFIYWKDLLHPYNNGSDPFGYRTRSKLKSTFAYPSMDWVVNDRLSISLKGRYNIASNEDRLQNKNEDYELPDTFRSSKVTTNGGELQVNYQINPKGIIVVGSDLQSDAVQSIQFGNRHTSQASYYVQYDQRLWGLLKTSIGARYDSESVQDLGRTGELSRKLGLNLSLGMNTHFRLSLGEGFRVPAVTERFISTFTAGIRLSPNPTLRPERSQSIEVGFRQAILESINIDVALFYNKYKDLIEPQLDPDPEALGITVRFKNVIQARVQGFDISHRTDWWSKLISTRIGYSYIDSKDLSPGDDYGFPLKYRSKHTLYISNDLNYNAISMGVDFRYLSKIERVDAYHKVFIKDIDARVPTYVVSFRFGLVREHFSLRFLIDNVFNYNYLLSPANLAPPRTATIQLDLNY